MTTFATEQNVQNHEAPEERTTVDGETYLTVTGLATLSGLTVDTVRSMASPSGVKRYGPALPPSIKVGRTWLFRELDAIEWNERRNAEKGRSTKQRVEGRRKRRTNVSSTVLSYVEQGWSNREIAKATGFSQHTVAQAKCYLRSKGILPPSATCRAPIPTTINGKTYWSRNQALTYARMEQRAR